MGDHRRSINFRDDRFDVKILEESADRLHIENKEEYYIKKYNTFLKGLNKTPEGKGFGHNSKNFTTLGYTYSDKSRLKMSQSAKKRAAREGFEIRSQNAKKPWQNHAYRAAQSKSKRGRRLSPPKISDDVVKIMRDEWISTKHIWEERAKEHNKRNNRRGSCLITGASLFAGWNHKKYNCSSKYLKDIIQWKTRLKILPMT